MMEILRLEKVSSQRVTNVDPIRKVLREISFTVAPGEFLVLFGRSGGGKSTLLRLMNRLEEPSAGQVLFMGTPLQEIPIRELRRSVVLLMQHAVMFPGTVRDNLLLPNSFASDRSGHQQIADSQMNRFLERCQIAPELLAVDAATLSVGQQQRVALARALMLEPTVLLADEPTSALDRPTAILVADELRKFSRQEGCAAVMVSHDLELAERVADRMIFLEDGRLVEEGSPERLLANPSTTALEAFLATPDPEDGRD